MARVAVLLPVFNGAATLRMSLASLLEQTLTDIRILAVDDGSTDATRDILAGTSRRDSRLVVIRQPHNQGICSALNRAMSLAHAPLLARMDGDDWSHPERLERQADFLDNHPDIGLVGCQVEYGGDRHGQKGYAHYVDWTNTLLTPAAVYLNRFVESPLAHPSVMFRAVLPAAHGNYRDGPFPEDYELWLRWMDAGVRMAKIAPALLRWDDPPQRLSRTDARYAVRAFYACKAKYLARWLCRRNPHHPDVVVWGAGRESRKRAEMLVAHGVRITHYIDVDPRKIGQTIHGRPVWSENELPPPGQVFVISYVGSRGARDDIRMRLGRRGYIEGRDMIMAA